MGAKSSLGSFREGTLLLFELFSLASYLRHPVSYASLEVGQIIFNGISNNNVNHSIVKENHALSILNLKTTAVRGSSG